MAKYSVIVFDLGNVLLPFNYDLLIEKLNSVSPGLGENFKENYKNNYHIHREFESGKLSEDQFLRIMLDWTNNLFTKEEFCVLYSGIFSLNEKVAALLPALKEKYKLVLLSNTNSIHRTYGWNGYDFLKYFGKLILSHEVEAVKPEDKIYNAVTGFTGKPASEHFFIDDISEYVAAAQKLGWGGTQFTNYENLIDELKKNNIL